MQIDQDLCAALYVLGFNFLDGDLVSGEIAEIKGDGLGLRQGDFRGRPYMSAASGSSDDPKICPTSMGTGERAGAAQMPKQLSDSTKHFDISVESTNPVDYSSLIPLPDRLVGPDVPASSPSHRRSRSMLFTSCLVGVILAGGISAVIAFRQFSLPDIWRGRAQLHQPTLTMQGEQAPQLIVQWSRGNSGEPIRLGLTIYGPTEGAVIIITGLLPGMELSNGIKVDVERWKVRATQVSYTWIAPPDGFVGSALLTAELRLTDDSIADRQAIHLEWVPSSPPGFAKNQYNREEAAGPTPPVLTGERDLEKAAAIPSSPSLAPSQFGREAAVVSPSFPRIAQPVAGSSQPAFAQRQLDREEVTVLLKRGKDLIANGDIAAARLVLQRAADANDVEATLALAATYDPYVLRELKVYSFAADVEMARAWYEKARQLGSSAASRRLEMLSNGAR